MTAPRALAIAAGVLGVAAALAGSPYRAARGRIDVAELARMVAREEDHVTAIELAGWIRDRRPRLEVIDVRSAAEFATDRIPTAVNIPLEDIAHSRFAAADTLVLYSGGGAHAAQAWVFLRALGSRNVFFLRGGFDEWRNDIMAPEHSTELTRYFGGVARQEGAPPPQSSPASPVERAPREPRRGC